ncbi:MAG TPA: GspE/PulE family protein [Tepidisphaeraceae bacterium]|nr:GspE/PulE family protein [Tepidisphaeraceae bacterium]
MAKSKVENWLEEMERESAATELAELPPVALVPSSEEALSVLWSPQPSDSGKRKTVEEILAAQGKLDADKLLQARTVQANSRGKKVSQILHEMAAVGEVDIQRAVAEMMGLEFEAIDPKKLDRRAFDYLPSDFMKARGCCGVRLDEGRLILGMVDPADIFLLEEVKRRVTVKQVKVVVVCLSHIVAAIEAGNSTSSEGEKFDEIIKDMGEEELEIVAEEKEELTDLAKASGESPVIRLVNFLIFDAIKQGASDIHIEPHEKRLVVRFRIDGVLFEAMNPPAAMQAAVSSRLKIMANMDISERRLPQDGRIRTMVHGRHVDLRVSTVPTQYGEKTVIRILDNRSITLGLEQLGFSEDMLVILRKQIDRPNGIILVTGPTGSGKTTTLYSCLRCMDGAKMNISTVEDPVEYHLGFANQIQVMDRIGMTFAAALRALLRQDPDVIMLGEIRDTETAHIAVQAAMTGHMVLSTLHTNDAPSSVTRLINIGVEPYLISAAVNAVLAQRLVRRICGECKEPWKDMDADMREFLETRGFDPNNIFKGRGCDKCRNTGYKGRVGIYELLVLDDVARDLVVRNPNVTELRRICKERGMVSLREDGLHKVAAGSTTIEEVMSATENTM